MSDRKEKKIKEEPGKGKSERRKEEKRAGKGKEKKKSVPVRSEKRVDNKEKNHDQSSRSDEKRVKHESQRNYDPSYSVTTPATAPATASATASSFRIPRVKHEPGDVKPALPQLSQPSSFPPALVHFSRRRSEPQICQYWLEGKCAKSASECLFDHEGEVERIFEKCKFYLSKGCKKGKACPFLHEKFPCKKFHLMGSCDDSPCGFSHDPLTEQTRPLFEEEVIWWRNSIESLLEEEQPEPQLHALLSQIDEAMWRLDLSMAEPPPLNPAQEVNYNGYRGPNGKLSDMRYAMNGTANLLSYANDQTAKWDAFEVTNNALIEFERDEYMKKYHEIRAKLALEEDDWDNYSRESGFDEYDADEKESAIKNELDRHRAETDRYERKRDTDRRRREDSDEYDRKRKPDRHGGKRETGRDERERESSKHREERDEMRREDRHSRHHHYSLPSSPCRRQSPASHSSRQSTLKDATHDRARVKLESFP